MRHCSLLTFALFVACRAALGAPAAPAGEAKAPLKSERIPLKYAAPDWVIQALRSPARPGPAGPQHSAPLPGLTSRPIVSAWPLPLPLVAGITAVETDKEPNTLRLTGKPEALQALRSLVSAAEEPVPQVRVAVRLFAPEKDALVGDALGDIETLRRTGFVTGDPAQKLADALPGLAAHGKAHLLMDAQVVTATGTEATASGSGQQSPVEWLRVTPFVLGAEVVQLDVQLFVGRGLVGGTYHGRLAMHRAALPPDGKAALWISGSEEGSADLVAVLQVTVLNPRPLAAPTGAAGVSRK